MSVRRTLSVCVAAAAILAQAGSAGAQDHELCVRLEARLADLGRARPQDDRSAIQRYNSELMEQQRMLSAARQQAARAGCNRQGGFLFFQPPRMAGCAEHDAVIARLEDNVRRLQARRRQVMPPPAPAANEGERRRILAMLGDNDCGPQYERYATRRNGRKFGMFLRDYTRDPYVREPREPRERRGYGNDYGYGYGFGYGTYRTLCVRTCDGFYWPISFSTVERHFGYDARQCEASCPTTDVALYVHRNPGGGPEDAMSLAGRPISAMPNAFRYRQEIVDGCTCESEVRTAALGERVTVDLSSRNAERPVSRPGDRDTLPGTAIPVPVPRTRPGNAPPVAGSIATLTGLEDYNAVPAPPVSRVTGQDVRIVGPDSTLYRSAAE